MLELQLASNDTSLCETLDLCFGAGAIILQGESTVSKLNVDCIVDFGNSFGFVSQSILDRLGGQIQTRVRNGITQYYAGQMPIGACLLLETHNLTLPYLAYAPATRLTKLENHYDSMAAVLRQITIFNTQYKKERGIEPISSVLIDCSSPFEKPLTAATQMALAHKHFNNPINNLSELELLEARVDEIRYVL